MVHPLIKISKSLLGKEQGQTLVEYALILVLISIVVVVILQLLGIDLINLFTNIRATILGSST